MTQLLKKIAAYVNALHVSCSVCLCVKIHRFLSNTDLVILLRTTDNSIINKLMRHLLMQFSSVFLMRFSSYGSLHIFISKTNTMELKFNQEFSFFDLQKKV